MATTLTAPTTVFPELAYSYSLTSQQSAAFERDGYVRLPELCSRDEAAACREAITGAALAHNTQNVPLEERNTYGKAFLQIENLWLKDENCKRYTLARRFGEVAAKLLDVPAVRLWHDQALFKEPGGGPTTWHQDHHFWPLDTDMVVLWMPLVDMTAEMGAMTFAVGSQHDGHVAQLEISDESEDFFERYLREKNYELQTPGAMAAGDATFHNAWTIHRALANTTATMREVMTVIYFPDGARIHPPVNRAQEYDIKTWLPGCAPGDLAASPLNPVIYDARRQNGG